MENKNIKKYDVALYVNQWPLGDIRETIGTGLSLEEARALAKSTFHTRSEIVVIEDPMAQGVEAIIERFEEGAPE